MYTLSYVGEKISGNRIELEENGIITKYLQE